MSEHSRHPVLDTAAIQAMSWEELWARRDWLRDQIAGSANSPGADRRGELYRIDCELNMRAPVRYGWELEVV